MKTQTQKLTGSAIFLALALVLPFLTGQIPAIGSMLLPMHYPVFLCGIVCGPFYGALVGLICPLLRSLLFGMPPMYPTAIAMAFELAAYGLAIGLVFNFGKKNMTKVYVALIASMLIGRIVWGIAQMILLGFKGGTFTFAAFMAGAFTNALVGIVIQIVLIPAIVFALHKAKLISFN